MVTDMFGSLLQELSAALKCPPLHSDSNNACLLNFKNGVSVQIQVAKGAQFLLLSADLGMVPSGKYRENLFREALKSNDMPHPLHGILGYSQRKNHLILFKKMNLTELNGEKIAAELIPFNEKAAVWFDALTRGEIPVINLPYTSDHGGGGMFGLRP